MLLSDLNITIGFEIEFCQKGEYSLWLPLGWSQGYDSSIYLHDYLEEDGGFKREVRTSPLPLLPETRLPEDWEDAFEYMRKHGVVNSTCGIHAHLISPSHPISIGTIVPNALFNKFKHYPNKWRKTSYAKPKIERSIVDRYSVISLRDSRHIEIRAFDSTLNSNSFLRYFLQIKKVMIQAAENL